ncbi:uncharacterized protein KY384_002344 [Bacidia gigantensis]|uniref:uncharacterized protein n=1 Tax=Bacidia gigantensis TaxID=2732470 RepID=UPI001D04EA04|nr:uncharacterized protein KY384_002344 [Bacidia gigantensis]KAG8532467.1 hypothetical protein KY384_002344 [Bacidia gigantensis]
MSKGAQKSTLKAPTETQSFERTNETVNIPAPRLIEIMQKHDKLLPANTAKAIIRDFEHGDDKHINVVCFDKDGKFIETVHIPLETDVQLKTVAGRHEQQRFQGCID